MHHAKQDIGSLGSRRIDVNALHDLHDWAEHLRTTADTLREIVRRVGDRADDVERYLRTQR